MIVWERREPNGLVQRRWRALMVRQGNVAEGGLRAGQKRQRCIAGCTDQPRLHQGEGESSGIDAALFRRDLKATPLERRAAFSLTFLADPCADPADRINQPGPLCLGRLPCA